MEFGICTAEGRLSGRPFRFRRGTCGKDGVVADGAARPLEMASGKGRFGGYQTISMHNSLGRSARDAIYCTFAYFSHALCFRIVIIQRIEQPYFFP